MRGFDFNILRFPLLGMHCINEKLLRCFGFVSIGFYKAIVAKTNRVRITRRVQHRFEFMHLAIQRRYIEGLHRAVGFFDNRFCGNGVSFFRVCHGMLISLVVCRKYHNRTAICVKI